MALSHLLFAALKSGGSLFAFELACFAAAVVSTQRTVSAFLGQAWTMTKTRALA
jgi:hypothetical protein